MTGPSTSASRPALPALTGVRALAAFGPVLVHALALFDNQVPIVRHGYLGVDFFFMLSGFVLAYVHAEQMQPLSWRGYGRFLALRLGRIWPAYVVVLVYFGAIAAWHGQWWRDPLGSEPRRFVLHALMLQNWGLTTPNEFNWPAWSVSAEWLVYLLFPLFVLAWARTPRRAALLAIPLLLAGMAALFAAAGYSTITLNEGMGLLRALVEFAVGFLLWRLYRAGEVQRWNWSAIGALSLGLVIALVVLSAGQSWTDFPLVALFAPLMLSLAYGRGPLARICSTRAIVFLGEASYSIYLVHFAVLRRVLDIMTRHASDWPPVALASLFIASVVLGSLAAGVALHLLVERPCRRLVRQSLGLDMQTERRAAPVNAPG